MLGWLNISGWIFNTGTPFAFIISLLTLAGLGLLLLLKGGQINQRFLQLVAAAAFAGLLSHFVTLPIMGTHLVPSGLFEALFFTLQILLIAFAIKIGLAYLRQPKLRMAAVLVIGLLFAGNAFAALGNFQSNQYYGSAKSPVPPFLAEPAKWALANTSLSDVFLTTNEDGYALNALSGRKLVTYRRTHSPTYADMDRRMMDAAIMLYGNDSAMRGELLRKYGVKYLYWSARWVFNEFNFNDKGQVTDFLDPLMAKWTPERESELKAAGVPYQISEYYLDPAWLPSYPKYKVIVAMPARLSAETPWSQSLDALLEQVYEYSEGGQKLVKVFKIRAEA
jgi:hypothetical protein